MMASYNIVTLNCKSLCDKTKRSNIFNWLLAKNIHIAFLQETFIKKEIEKIVERDWAVMSYHNVCILLDKQIDIVIESRFCDNVGRSILLNVTLDNQKITFINWYAPNNVEERIRFLDDRMRWINIHALIHNYIIVAGDLNTIDDNIKRYSNRLDRFYTYFTYFKRYLNI